MVLQGFQVALFGIRDAITPTGEEDANPLERQGADGGVVPLSFIALPVVILPCPVGNLDLARVRR